MAEGDIEHLVIGVLYPVGDGSPTRRNLARLDNQHLQEWNDRDGEEERDHQIDGNGPREVLQCVVSSALHRQ